MPALLTTVSIDLKRDSAVSTISLAVAGSPISPSTRATRSEAATSLDWVILRELATTLKPRSTSPFTIPAPIPCEAPVTMAVFIEPLMVVHLSLLMDVSALRIRRADPRRSVRALTEVPHRGLPPRLCRARSPGACDRVFPSARAPSCGPPDSAALPGGSSDPPRRSGTRRVCLSRPASATVPGYTRPQSVVAWHSTTQSAPETPWARRPGRIPRRASKWGPRRQEPVAAPAHAASHDRRLPPPSRPRPE